MEKFDQKDRLCIVLTKCDYDDEVGSIEKAYRKVLQTNGLSSIPIFEVSNIPSLKLQLPGLINWSVDQLSDEDFRQSFIGSQMVDLEMKKSEAGRIINNACVSTGLLKILEMLNRDDKSKALAEHQMRMVTRIFAVYGIDCLEGLTKKFEKATSFVNFGNRLVSWVVEKIPWLKRHEESFKAGTMVGLTKAVGTVASKISYSYVEKHIKGIPVYYEEFFSDPESAGFLISMINNILSSTGNGAKESKRKEKASNKNGHMTNGKK